MVFPAVSHQYTWKIVAVETNRTISRHKLLNNAVEKAERLNVEALSIASSMPKPVFAERVPLTIRETLGTCNSWYVAVDVRKRYKPTAQLIYGFPGEADQWMRA